MCAQVSHLLEQLFKEWPWRNEKCAFCIKPYISRGLGKNYFISKIRLSRKYSFHYTQIHDLCTEKKIYLLCTSISESARNTLTNQEGVIYNRII